MKNILIKIGGSVITDKHHESGSIDKENLQRIANVISKLLKTEDSRLIVIHGAGSYAHPYMAKTEKKRGMDSCDVDNIRESMSELSAIISGAFSNAGIENFTDTLPENFCAGKDEWSRLVARWTGETRGIPLLHGNVVLCKGKVLKISGDELVEKIGSAWGKPLIVLVSKHPVCDKNPDFDGGAKVLSRITPMVFDSMKHEIIGSSYMDATGSMLGKLEYLVKLAGGGIESYIVNIEGFEEIFDNSKKVIGCGSGTRICR